MFEFKEETEFELELEVEVVKFDVVEEIVFMTFIVFVVLLI